MKKNIKNNLLWMMIGMLMCGSVVAASSYMASDVTFTPKDKTWNVSNVADAIDTLYAKSEVNCVKSTFVCDTCNTSSGQTIELGFKPSFWLDYNASRNTIDFYSETANNSTMYTIQDQGVFLDNVNTYYVIGNNSLTIKNYNPGNVGKTLNYVACK